MGGIYRLVSYLSHCIQRAYPVPSLSLPPELSDFDSLDEQEHERNNQLAFDVAEREFGISPCMTGKEMSSVVEPDKLSMVMYLSQFYEMFKDTVPPGGESGRYSKVAYTQSFDRHFGNVMTYNPEIMLSVSSCFSLTVFCGFLLR